MLKIRLQRTGKRGQAYFRVVVLEHTTKPKGKYLEFLGSYDPHKNEISVKADRVKYWLSMGAHLSETANNLLVGKGVIEGEKVKVWKPKPRRKEVGVPTETSGKKTEETVPVEKPQTEEAAAPEKNEGEGGPTETAEETIPAPAEEVPTDEVGRGSSISQGEIGTKTEQEPAQPTP